LTSHTLLPGVLWINEASGFRLRSPSVGGVKQSGVGREGVRYAIEEMSQLRFVGIRI
jgi:acyl-CoA reductase-like NAD-dependent aldehyde dehydrogenase